MIDPPLPPPELRALVGPLEDRFYENPAGAKVFPYLPDEAYDTVLDWGCGCGRLARQLWLQRPRPRRYLGLDLHLGMIEWCSDHLAPHAPGFEFRHQDVYNRGLNPAGPVPWSRFPVDDRAVSLLVAWSVFTHVNEAAASFYLSEVARVLSQDGFAVTTWLLFDKSDFPMMQEFQNALFINDADPSNAVIFDKAWLRRRAREEGLVLSRIVPPEVRGFQWQILVRPEASGAAEVPFPEDAAPRGRAAPPLLPVAAERLGRRPRVEDGRESGAGG